MKTPDFLSNKYIKSGLLVLAGLFFGWLLFHSSGKTEVADEKTAVHEHSETEATIWTCSMHPQIKTDKPGLCPICGMELIPLNKTATADATSVTMSEAAMKLSEIQTSVVAKGKASKEVRLYGKIQPDEERLQSQTAHIPGRIEKLYVNVTGQTVKKGQRIASVYSPELITAQKELLEAASLSDKYPAILESAREKLRNWKLSEKQIQTLESSSKVISTFDIYANTSGIVSDIKVNMGDYINKGAVLFDVADLSGVWAIFDAYESDLPWISMGQTIKFTTQALPGKVFSGKISFIDLVVDPSTRTARVRAAIPNGKLELKPEYFIDGVLESSLKNAGNKLIIPQSAVLWTGKRSVVYVKVPNAETPTFQMREITLGETMNEAYVVEAGLNEGDEIVTNGAFNIDAAAQLEGKPSMMNRDENTATTQMKTETEMNRNKSTDLTESKKIMVSGNCDMCKARIEKAAKSVAGVDFANWNSEEKALYVRYLKAKTNSDAIQKAIAKAGHDTEKYKAADSDYKKLPECCLYRE